jgi:hypothetical protein
VIVRNAIGEPTGFSASVQLVLPQPIFSEVRKFEDGTFGATLKSLLNQQGYAIETSTNLTNWSVLKAFTATNTSAVFLDANAPAPVRKFYRARSEP